jgi:Tfp pilus assembly protein PilF
MMTRHRSKHSYLLTTLAFTLAIVAGAAGLARCFVQSPQSRAENYLTLSQQALPGNPLYAASAAWEAARINPSSIQAWNMLALALHQNGDETASLQAQKIAARLQGGEGEIHPLYAMPAELRLSLLALSEGDL